MTKKPALGLAFAAVSAIALARGASADPPRAAASAQVTVVNLINGAPAISVSTRSARNAPPAVVHASIALLGRGTAAMNEGIVQLIVQRAGAAPSAAPFGAPQPWMISSGRTMHLLLGTGGLENVIRVDLSNSPPPPAGSGLMRFVNGVSHAESVDLCTAGATPAAAGTVLWMNTGENTTAAMPDGASGRPIERTRVAIGAPQRWQIRAWANPPCSGRVIASGEVSIDAANPAVVAVATGDAAGRAPLNMYLCPENAGDCRAFTFAR